MLFRWGNLHRCSAKIKIEIRSLKLRGFFFLFISKHMSLWENKNSKIPKIRPPYYIYINATFINSRGLSVTHFGEDFIELTRYKHFQ